MKKIAFFCIPAHGHTNPMLPVAEELVKRGNIVRFYSFNEFKDKIISTGAEFISCDSYLPKLTEREELRIRNASVTEMIIHGIRISISINSFLDDEFNTFRPDIVYTDSFCFWGKLYAWKHNLPMVVSTSTFAFNQMSCRYIKNTFREIVNVVFGIQRVFREFRKLCLSNYNVKKVFSLVVSDNQTDTIVYTSRSFQPYLESFSDRYAFVGPSVFSKIEPNKEKTRPLVYISMGTIVNYKLDFYIKCIEALKTQNFDVIISCGNTINPENFGILPDNIKIYTFVDQLDILSKADVFITHCGMNSVSESLYMATPMVLYPQTMEQHAVARRTLEIGAGVMLIDDSSDGICLAVSEILNNIKYGVAARECSVDFRSCSGINGAAYFIENAPHSSNGVDIIRKLNIAGFIFQLIYWILIIIVISFIGFLISWKYVWVIPITAIILSMPISKQLQKIKYASLVKKISVQRK